MNLFQAVNDAMSIALTTDERAGNLSIKKYIYIKEEKINTFHFSRVW